jgi:hypothetical protein
MTSLPVSMAFYKCAMQNHLPGDPNHDVAPLWQVFRAARIIQMHDTIVVQVLLQDAWKPVQRTRTSPGRSP